MALFFLWSCENNIDTVNLLTSSDKHPVESGKNIEIIYSDSAKVKMRLFGPVMNKYQTANPYVELPKGVRVEFYDSKMVVKSKLSSKYAIKYENEHRVVMKQDVVVVNENGEKLNTEYLVWDQDKKLISSDKFVKITTRDEVIYGEGLEANEKFTKYKITKPQGVINVRDNE